MATTQFTDSNFTYKFAYETALASTTVQNITSGAATVYNIFVDNLTAGGTQTVVYLKLYDTLPNGGIDPGSTSPDYIFKIPTDVVTTLSFPGGLSFSTGLSMRCVKEKGTGGTTAPDTSVLIHIMYK